MRRLALPLVVIVLLALLVLSQTLYVVDERELAIVTRFGEFQRSTTQPGLYAKTPLIDSVVKQDSRLLRVDSPAESLLTADKRNLIIDAYARYRIVDPLQFFRTLRDERGADARVRDIVASELRREVALDRQSEIIEETREDVMRRISDRANRVDIPRAEALELEGGLRNPDLEIVIGGIVEETQDGLEVRRDRPATPEEIEQIIEDPNPDFLEGRDVRYRLPVSQRLGLDIVDVRIKSADFPEGVQESVFDRMRAERERIASLERAEGEQRAAEIRARVDRQTRVIREGAEGQSSEVRGEAERQAIEILAEQLGRDPEFYSFQRSLEAYRSLLDENSTLLLNADSELFRYLESPLAPDQRETDSESGQ
ncbi:MAG: protease modulator HflC [Chloroflexota bacterium]